MPFLLGCGKSSGGSGSGGFSATIIDVQFTGNGSGRVTSNPAGIDCPGACAMSAAAGTSVILTEVADSGSTFIGWGGGCSGSGGCVVSGERTVWVNFAAKVPPPPPPQCRDIAAPAAVQMQQFVHPLDGYHFSCLPGLGDASGTMAFPRVFNDPNAHGWSADLITTAGVAQKSIGDAWNKVSLLDLPSGFAGVGGPDYLGPARDGVHVARWDPTGNPVSDTLWSGKNYTSAAGAGVVVVAGDLSTSPTATSFQHSAYVFFGGAAAPTPLASAGPVFGAGVDLLGRALVITGGAATGVISAQWIDRNGTALTGEFTLLSGFVAGSSTWFETSPLIGSGLMVRRMDFDGTLHAQALVVVASGSATVQPAPGWMVARPDTRLQIARTGNGYAVLPYGARGVACSQRLELVAPDGTTCGALDHPIAVGSCDTRDLTLTEEGTVIQQLPSSMETQDPVMSTHSCTWRWWPRAVQ